MAKKKTKKPANIVGNYDKNDRKSALSEKKFKHSSTRFLDAIPRRKRSKRRSRCLSRQCSKMNDCTFDYHLENIWRSMSEDKRASFAHVDSLCFLLYKKKQAEALELIKKKDVFSKTDHWRLMIICHFGESTHSKTRTRCILLLDSVEISSRLIECDARKFVFDIFKAEGRPESKDVIYRIPFLVPKVPQQTNDVDCGLFVLYFIRLFMDAAPKNFSISNGYPYFGRDIRSFILDGTKIVYQHAGEIESFPFLLITSSKLMTLHQQASSLMMKPNWFDSANFSDFCNKLEKEIPTHMQATRVSRRISQRIRKTVFSRKASKRDLEVILVDDY